MRAVVSELEEIREVFGLTRSEIADLLGRRAQSVSEWETRGIPREKRASVERLLDLAQVFRKRTILETLRTDGVDPIYGYLGRLFSYGGT
jgi:transcriptional regulator with XRE-family HTH domain